MAEDFLFVDFEDYLEQLCRENKDVQHEVAGQICFSRLRSQSEINQLVNNAGKKIVLLGRFNGRVTGEADDQTMRNFAVIRFACYAENTDGDMEGGIDAALDTSFLIMMQFLAKMRKDYRDDSCGAVRDLELKNAGWDEIDEKIYLENHYGWDLTLPFKAYLPGYDAAKWE